MDLVNDNGLKDTYSGTRGRIYRLVSYTTEYAFLRGENYGHVERIMVRRDSETGEVHPGLFPVKSYRPAYDNADLWLKQNSEHFPVQHVTQNVKNVIEAASKDCPSCDEASIREWNEQRLLDSKNMNHE